MTTEIRYRVWGGNDAQGKRKPDRWLTEAELEKRWDWRLVHPDVRRRHLALYIASEHEVGFLSGARSAAQQAQLYIDRNGVGVAPADVSFHEDDSYEDEGQTWALAIDNIGDMDLLVLLAPEFGLYTFVDLTPSEPWHTQPDEMPRSRSTFKKAPGRYRLRGAAPPTLPEQEPLPTEDDDMTQREFVIVGNDDNHSDPNRFLYDGMDLRHLSDETDVVDVALIWGLNIKIHPEAAGLDMDNARAKVDAILRTPYWKPLDWINQRLAERA